jgi:O-antigen/teichoic acid export membrane protein
LLLPIFSKMIKQNEPVGQIVKLSYTLLIVPAIIIAVSSFYYDQEIMSFLYTSNTAYSADILGILMIGFTGIATTYIFGTLLTANGSLKQLNLMALAGMVLNVILNLILIPRFQAFGSAYASLATQIFTGLAQLILALYIFKLNLKTIFVLQLLVFIGVTVALASVTKNMDNWFFGYMAMVAGSFLFAFLIRLVSLKDLLKLILYR